MPLRGRRIAFALAALLAAAVPATADTRYADPALGFTVVIPSVFASDEAAPGMVQRWNEIGGDAQLQLYGGSNKDGLGIVQFAAMLERADDIRTITYRRISGTWLVLSGYRRDRQSGQPVVFYAKFMFSPDLERFGAFEVSYPAMEKAQLDPLVERLEASMRGPR